MDAETDAAPLHYEINCAHPTHFEHTLAAGEEWVSRLGGVRANASSKSHAELNAATELDEGDPEDLARRLASLRRWLPHSSILGGCCGTDLRHIRAIARACR